MTTNQHLVRDYLARLEVATADLPPDLRDDVRADVEAHLEEVAASAASEADLRAAIDRLGPPETIAAAGRESLPTSPPATGRAGGGTSRAFDVLAVLLLLIGGIVLPGIGWVIGAVLLWVSSSWTTGEKLLGTLVWPGGFLAPLAMGLVGFGGLACETLSEIGPDGVETVISTTCPPTGTLRAALPMVVLAVTLLAPVVVAIVLLRRAEGRRGTGAAASGGSSRVVVGIVVAVAVLAVLALTLAGAGVAAWMRVS